MASELTTVRLNRRRSLLPTLFTLGNLLCGAVSIFLAARVDQGPMPFGWSHLTFAAIALFVGMLFDALDGRIARMTGSTSELGEQLDSMADMVSFGVAPAFLVVQLVEVGTPFLGESPEGDGLFDRAAFIVAGIFVACAALRLARFNVELQQDTLQPEPSAEERSEREIQDAAHDSFSGLPSPGAAGTVASLVILHQHLLFKDMSVDALQVKAAAIAMVAVSLLCALAMVSRIRYAHLINRLRGDSVGVGKLAVVLVLLGLMLVKPQFSFAACFTLYAVSGPLGVIFRGRKKKG